MDAKVVAFAVVGVAACVVAIYQWFSEKEKPTRVRSHGGNKSNPPPPLRPPSPPSVIRKRSSSSGYSSTASNSGLNSTQSLRKCKTCEDCPTVTIEPCKHSTRCTRCFMEHLDSDYRCPDCKIRIDRCYPQSKTQGKCKGCKKFSNLMLVQPCGHASVCAKCFDKHLGSCGSCPDCKKQIERCQPHSSARGECKVCDEFSLLMQFLPCGHYCFCEKHAKMFLDQSNWRCNECGKKISEIL